MPSTLTRVRRVWVGLLLVAALIPVAPEEAAACSPRTFTSIQPPAAGAGEVAPAPDTSDGGEPASAEGTPPEEQPVPDEPAPAEPAPAEPAPVEPPPVDPPPVDPAPVDEPAEPVGAEEVPPSEPAPWRPPPPVCSYVYRMGFPVFGGGSPGWSLFGEPRDGGARLHAGVDILAPKMTPVVAVRSGTVSTVRDAPGDCCWVAVRHDDGWLSMYVHLNNDTVGTNDGQGVGIRPDLREGVRVAQGELLGWIGNSGNAEGGPPHLHFELRTPWGEPIDPGPSLYSARRRAHPASLDAPLDAAYSGAFIDYGAESAAEIFDTATALGLPSWCDTWGVRACPGNIATREAVSRWITALTGDVEAPFLYFTLEHPVDDPTPYLSAYDTCDTPPVCGQPVTRGEVAQLIVAALHPDLVTDQAGSIALLHTMGTIDSCDPRGLDATEELTRTSTLRMLLRAWGYAHSPPCGLIS